VGNLLTNWGTVSFWRRTVPCAVSCLGVQRGNLSVTVFLFTYMKCEGKLTWPACLIWWYVVKESGSRAPHILNLVTGQGGVIGSWENPSTHWILVCAVHRSCLDSGEEKKISPCQEQKPDCPGQSLVTILTELSRLITVFTSIIFSMCLPKIGLNLMQLSLVTTLSELS